MNTTCKPPTVLYLSFSRWPATVGHLISATFPFASACGMTFPPSDQCATPLPPPATQNLPLPVPHAVPTSTGCDSPLPLSKTKISRAVKWPKEVASNYLAAVPRLCHCLHSRYVSFSLSLGLCHSPISHCHMQ